MLIEKKNVVIMLSLIGHFENASFYIKTSKSIKSKINFEKLEHFRFKTKNLHTVFIIIFKILSIFIKNKNVVFLIPRSNSRLIIFFAKVFSQIPFYSYSDGIGDVIHEFKLDKKKNYIGHIGCKLLSSNNIINLPISICFEPWLKMISFQKNAATLIIFKYPKEIEFDSDLIDQYFLKIVSQHTHRKIYISGNFKHIFKNGIPGNITNIGSLSSTPENIKVSSVVSFPSTVLFGLAKVLPRENIIVLDMPKNSTNSLGFMKMSKYKEKALLIIQSINKKNEV